MANQRAKASKKRTTTKNTSSSAGASAAGRNGDETAVTPRTSARAAAATARAERTADPELRELGDEAIDRLDDRRNGAIDRSAPDDETIPELAGGDVDAAVTDTGSGEEAVGGSTPTPDQDNVEEQGAALGVTYQPDEPLHTTEKIARRDDERWELNPASSEDFAERRNLEHALPEQKRRRAR